ncbi:hypothetical protein CTEN210_09955 [Chaetoceros tenuissimus]|uniref:Uncharacterized protein n=1 Tax=Chaetoceros tenuissimus TaxID=426638 RepID=A0AAD3H856_9STRA|nr:hypothetical protein CTEN210_09955 [Chaetoceros tenuissimus]
MNTHIQSTERKPTRDHILQDRCSYLISNRSWDALEKILTSSSFSREVDQSQRYQPNTILHDACRSPTIPLEIVSNILAVMPDSCGISDEDGYLPIHLICCTNEDKVRLDLLQLLLVSFPESSFEPTPDGSTIAFDHLVKNMVALCGISATLKYIDSLPDDALYNMNTSVLHQVCNQLLPDQVIDLLLRKFPDICKIRCGGNTLLHIICSHKNSSLTLVEKLISMFPEACGMKDDEGNLPLHVVNSKDHSPDIIKALLKCNPNGLFVCNMEGQLPLLSPLTKLSAIRVRTMLEYGQSITNMQELLRAPNKFGISPIDEFNYDLETYVTGLILEGALDYHDLDSNRKATKSLQNDEIQLRIESLFSVMNVALYNSTTYPQHGKHDELFWTSFPLFTKLLTKLYPEFAIREDWTGDSPLHIVSRHCFHQRHENHKCNHCNNELADQYYVFHCQNTFCYHCVKQMPHWAQSLCSVQLSGQSLLKDFVSLSPERTSISDSMGVFPLHSSLKSGKVWQQGVQELAAITPDIIEERDQYTNLLPFMISAAVGGDAKNLTTTYELLRMNPTLLRPVE